MRLGVALLSMFAVAGSAYASPSCAASAEPSAAYAAATHVVQALPQVRAWQQSHGLPVVYGAPADKQVLIAGSCYWSVSVYANHPERLELWHVFYVAVQGGRVLVQDQVSGEPLALEALRQAKAGS
jgi:hypothetical protein